MPRSIFSRPTELGAQEVADSMESEKLIDLIEEVFPAYPVPKVTLRQRTLSDEGMRREFSREEWENAGHIDRTTPWTALSDSDLIECKAGIPHLTTVEFSYYLGALMRFAIRHLNASTLTPEGSLVSTVMFVLTNNPSVDSTAHASPLWYWGTLDHHQAEVVRTFLRYVTSHSRRFGDRMAGSE